MGTPSTASRLAIRAVSLHAPAVTGALKIIAGVALFLPTVARAQNLSARSADVHRIGGSSTPYQETITHDEFVHALLEKLYAPHGGWQPWIRVDARCRGDPQVEHPAG